MRLTTILATICVIVIAAIVATHLYRTEIHPESTVWTYMGADAADSGVVVTGGVTAAERAAAAQRWHSIRSQKAEDKPTRARAQRRTAPRETRRTARGFRSSSGHVQDRTFGRALQAQRSHSLFERSRRYKMWGSHTQPNRQRRDQYRNDGRRRRLR